MATDRDEALIAWGAPLAAPAKLNLFLHVVGRRADGYHLIESVFRLIDLADTLWFTPRIDDQIRLLQPLEGVPEDENLVVRAARRLQAETGCRKGVDIRIEKRIPLGGGLGGGSSDAATTLVALDRLWALNIGRNRLADIGVSLGADVPVFVHGRNAFATGIGEALQPIDLAPTWYVVLFPPVAIPTREIFTAPDLTRNSKPTTITAFFAGRAKRLTRTLATLEAPKTATVATLCAPDSCDSSFRNDLEPVACRLHPIVGEYLGWLDRFAPARMSGSGSSVFGEFASEAAARSVIEALPATMTGIVARGLDRHPLAE